MRGNSKILLPIAIFVYAFLFAPIVVMVLAGFTTEPWNPFGGSWTLEWVKKTTTDDRYIKALSLSLKIAFCVCILTVSLALPAAVAVTRYDIRKKLLFLIISLAPLILPNLLLGVSILLLYGELLGMPSGLMRAVLSNVVHCYGFTFLVILASLALYDWRYEGVARVCGANGWYAFWHVTFRIIWPGVLGGLMVAFLLAFNDLEVTFYQVGALRTMPTLAWGMLRHGIKPELYAFSGLVIMGTLLVVGVVGLLIKAGLIEKGGAVNR